MREREKEKIERDDAQGASTGVGDNAVAAEQMPQGHEGSKEKGEREREKERERGVSTGVKTICCKGSRLCFGCDQSKCRMGRQLCCKGSRCASVVIKADAAWGGS